MISEERRKQLADNIMGSEELCNYCPLPEEARGVHCYGGQPVMCGGSKCPEAIQAYIDVIEEMED